MPNMSLHALKSENPSLRSFSVCCLGFIAGASALLAADPGRPSAHFKISAPMAIPGETLRPGAYTVQVLDHLTDRYVVRVQGPGGSEDSTFLGIPSKTVQGAAGMMQWSKPVDGVTYLRGWNFPGLPSTLEFAYPKNDAVAVAKANDAQVPAIDPESDGLVSKASLSKEEMHIVTLWLLTPTHVGPNSPGGIAAARYQQVASNARKPVIARLPHTASLLPWFWLLGAASFVSAAGLRAFRFSVKA